MTGMQPLGDGEGVHHQGGRAAVGRGAGVSALTAALGVQRRAESRESGEGDATDSTGGASEPAWLEISRCQREALAAEADAYATELAGRIGEPSPAEVARAEAFVDGLRHRSGPESASR